MPWGGNSRLGRGTQVGTPSTSSSEVRGRFGDIFLDRAVHGVAIDRAAFGKGHIGDHLEGGGQHFLKQVGGATALRIEPRDAGLGRAGHDRGQAVDVACAEHRRGRAPLPAPMRALGDEQALADRGFEDVLGDIGFRIVVKPLLQHPAGRAGVHHHMPADCGLSRHHRLPGGQFGNDLEHIAPRRPQRGEHPHRLGRQRHANGQVNWGYGVHGILAAFP
jgi:hypothetical protein